MPNSYTPPPPTATEADPKNGAPLVSSIGKALKFIIAAALTGLALGVIFVFVVLPGWVATPPPEPPVSTPTDAEQVTEIPAEAFSQASNIDPQLAAIQRKAAQDILATVLTAMQTLRAQQVEVWAADEFETVLTTVDEGELAYREGRFKAAQTQYTQVQTLLDQLAARIPDVIERYSDEGMLALSAGDAANARAAFQLALDIDTNHEAAKKGLGRAATLDEVLALVSTAQGHEEMQNTDAALSAYRQAHALDPQAPGADAAIDRILSANNDAAYSTTMSRGFVALSKKRFTAARKAFQQAAKLKPHLEQARDALVQVKNAQTSDKIEQHLSAASTLEKAEDWAEAAKRYASALKLDKNLAAAMSGVSQAHARADLDARLEAVLSRPARLADERVYTVTLTLQELAAQTTPRGARLSRQIASLDRMLIVARTPISLQLHSDNLTDVTIQRVGHLGTFETHELALFPGRYTVVGTKNGHRDVRIDFLLEAEKSPAPIIVQCDEQIALSP